MNSNLYQAMLGFDLTNTDKQLILEELIGLRLSVMDYIHEITDLLGK